MIQLSPAQKVPPFPPTDPSGAGGKLVPGFKTCTFAIDPSSFRTALALAPPPCPQLLLILMDGTALKRRLVTSLPLRSTPITLPAWLMIVFAFATVVPPPKIAARGG